MTESIGVLHVDDDPEFAAVTAEFLERSDDRLSVRTETTAADGLERLRCEDVDCVVSDYDMPGTDGLAFLDAVREEFPDLPFVLYTGKGSEEVASEAIARGATDYLQKGRGSEQYELLGNRIANAVEQYRAARRAAKHERISTVLRDVNRALSSAATRDGIENGICEVISDADPYQFAWVGRLDPDSDRIEPSAWAGVDGAYLEEITVTADESATGRGPGGVAVRERRVSVSQHVGDDPAFEPWRDAALDRGLRAVAAIPIEHDDALYGVLAVYADRPYAFDETERSLLADLGNDVGHAIHARELEADFRRSRARTAALFDRSPDMAFVHDADGTIRDVNAAASTVLGYEEEALVGRVVADVDATDPEADLPRSWEGLGTGESERSEGRFRRRDGSTFPVELHRTRFEADGADRILAVARDITDRVERERSLERYEEVVESVEDGIYVFDADGRFEFVNQRVVDVSGIPREAWIGRPLSVLADLGTLDEETLDEVQAAVDALARGEEEEARIELRPNAVTDLETIELRLTPFDAGDERRIIGYSRDVTDRNRRQRKLEALQRRTQSLMATRSPEEAARVAVETAREVLDAELCGFHRVSDDGERLEPVAVTDTVRETFDEPPAYDGSDRSDPVSAVVWETFDRGETLAIDDVRDHECLDGATPAASGFVHPIGDHGAFIVSATEAGAFDETDEALVDILASTLTVALQRAEREGLLRQRKRELSRQNERLDEFARVVSHDLRNPLQVVEGRVALAREAVDDEHLDAISRAVDRMSSMIDDLLATAREGEAAVDPEPIPLADHAEEAWRDVATGRATLVTETASRVVADRGTLSQVLENLYRNAVEHGSTSPDGTDLTVTVGDLDGDGFYVEDDGPGIPAEIRERVFERGFSASDEGTGFGLSIVARVADRHGWDVSATAGTAGGARFEFRGVDLVDE